MPLQSGLVTISILKEIFDNVSRGTYRFKLSNFIATSD